MTDTASPVFARLNEFIARTPPTTVKLWSDGDTHGVDRASLILTPWTDPDTKSGIMGPYARHPLGVERVDSPEAADFAVLAFDGARMIDQPYGKAKPEAIRFAQAFVDDAKRRGLATMVVVAGDSSSDLPVKFDVVLRHSVDAALHTEGTYCLPGWYDTAQSISDDFQIKPSPRGPRPRIGFMGQASSKGPEQWLVTGRELVKQIATGRLKAAARTLLPRRRLTKLGGNNIGSLGLRRYVLDRFSGFGGIDTDFVVRGSFFHNLGDKKQARDSFIQNLNGSDYVLCVRGFGNYSFRFYDALSNGRVPVLIDTDCALPFEEEFDYAALLPVVPLTRIDEAERIILEHYQSYSPTEWDELLRQLRRLYVTTLSPRGYFQNLGRLPRVRALMRSTAA